MPTATPLTAASIAKIIWAEWRSGRPDGTIPGLRLMPTASWVLHFRVGGTQRKMRLGAWPAMDLRQARQAARKALGEVASGEDPTAAKREAKQAAKEPQQPTDRVADIVALYIERMPMERMKGGKQRRESWIRESARLLNKGVVPAIGEMRLPDVGRRDIHRMLDSIDAPIVRRNTFRVLHRLDAWALGRGIIDRSICAGIETPESNPARTRVLADNEIALVWRAFEACAWPWGSLSQMLLLTGARLNEIASAKWLDADLDARILRVPAERSKNHEAHWFHLSDAALDILRGIPRIGSGEFLFSVTGHAPIRSFNDGKRAIDRMVTRLNAGSSLPNWTNHDLRRTLATNLQKLGVRLEVAESILNHKGESKSGVAGIYLRHTWDDERRAALDLWARRLAEIVSGEAPASNVVRMQRAEA
jgi:integrase